MSGQVTRRDVIMSGVVRINLHAQFGEGFQLVDRPSRRELVIPVVGCGSTRETGKRQKVVLLRELQRAIIYTTR